MKAIRPVTARSIKATDEGLELVLHDRKVLVPWERCSPILARATTEQRFCPELSPGGYGIHWALLDEDLSVEGLLRRVLEG